MVIHGNYRKIQTLMHIMHAMHAYTDDTEVFAKYMPLAISASLSLTNIYIYI